MKKYVFFSIISLILIMSSYPAASGPAPQYSVIPQNNEIICDTNPTISISFPRGLLQAIDLSSASVFLNKENITKRCFYYTSSVNYLPILPLSAGKNEISVIIPYKNKSGGVFSAQWFFTVEPHNDITSLEYDAGATLIENEVLNVTLKAKTGGNARFDIGNRVRNVQMRETSPGIYQGSYRVKESDNFGNEFITAHLKFNSQPESLYISKDKVGIKGNLFVVKVLSPKADEKVGQSFEIVGRTKPFARVSISSLMWLKNIPIVNELKASTGGYEAMADENGIFRMKYGIPFKLKKSTYTLKFLAQDEKGNYSIPTTVTVTTVDEFK